MSILSYNAGDPGSIPRLGRSPGEGNGNPLQYSCLENPMDRGAWQAIVLGVAKDTTERLHFHFLSNPDYIRGLPQVLVNPFSSKMVTCKTEPWSRRSLTLQLFNLSRHPIRRVILGEGENREVGSQQAFFFLSFYNCGRNA